MNPTASDIKSPASVSRLRCIDCGAVADRADQDFRCPNCGDLFEVFYPGWTNDRRLELLAGQRRRAQATLA